MYEGIIYELREMNIGYLLKTFLTLRRKLFLTLFVSDRKILNYKRQLEENHDYINESRAYLKQYLLLLFVLIWIQTELYLLQTE